MIFQDIIKLLREYVKRCETDGYNAQIRQDASNYEVRISKGDKVAIVRDGYYNNVSHNKKPPEITSYDVLLMVGNSTYLNYVSDYPLEEYPERIHESLALIDTFFSGNYQISQEKFMFFWNRRYMNITVGDKKLSLLETHATNQ